MIVAMYDEQRERTRAIAVYAFVGSAGASLGTVLGGVLTDLLSWHWIFFVNLPIGVATLLAARRWVGDDEGLGLREGADAPGALLIVAALMLAVYALVGAGEHGWGSTRTLGLGALAGLLLAAFVVREQRAKQPLVPLRLFAVRNVAAANLVQTVMIAGMFGQQFFIALYLQLVLGWEPTEVGLGMVPIALTIGLFSLGLSARMIERAGAKGVLVGGLLLITAGLLLMQRAPVDGRYWVDVLPALLVMGAGAGIAMPALPTLALARATPADAGLASGLLNTTQQVGAAIGVSLLASLAASRSETLRDDGHAALDALASGYSLAFAVAAGLALTAAGLAVTLLRPLTAEPRSSARPRR
jgi:MFS family permease